MTFLMREGVGVKRKCHMTLLCKNVDLWVAPYDKVKIKDMDHVSKNLTALKCRLSRNTKLVYLIYTIAEK